MGRSRRDRALLLTGMMGSGKSSVGRALARRLAWKFIDTDERIEALRGLAVHEIFTRDGEAAFRELERRVVRELPKREVVIALGGGAVVDPRNHRELQRRGVTVWLDARPETLAERLGDDPQRPVLTGATGTERIERLRRLQTERRKAYAGAEVRVATDGLTVEQVSAAVLHALGWEAAA